ncbi:hypothetical protein [Actinosynnema sp. NPDC023587]|uniref:NACHT N-terminal Helical domain 1-containing protein n=1 Tax=Actinosynnema sp. NPDC023587 TaxID=3154695 RepID=UPI003402914D
MSLLGAVLVKLAETVVKYAVEAGTGNKMAGELSAGAAGVLGGRATGLSDERKARRTKERVARRLADELVDRYGHEYRELPEGDRAAAVQAVIDTFELVGSGPGVVAGNDGDPRRLADTLRRESGDLLRQAALGRDGEEFYGRLLREACIHAVAVATHGPEFLAAADAETLSRLTTLSSDISREFARLNARLDPLLASRPDGVGAVAPHEVEDRRAAEVTVQNTLDGVVTGPVVQAGPVHGNVTINYWGDGLSSSNPEVSASARGAWQEVHFRGRRKLLSALTGTRLGPGDAEACPQFHEVVEIETALLTACSAILTGNSGCGKSVTAYQVMANRLHEGWKPVRLRDSARHLNGDRIVDDLLAVEGPVIALIDDAQSVPGDTLREVLEAAGPERWVLVVSTERVQGPAPVVRIAQERAVATLHAVLSKDLETLTREVNLLDPTVGDGAHQRPIEHRLRVAARQSTPWQFCFVLSGGWRRVEGALARLREQDEAHLALAAIAVGQIATADAGIPIDRLDAMAVSMGRDAAWVARSLDVLRGEQLISSDDGFYRCAHLQAAWSTLHTLLSPYPITAPPTKRPTVPPITGAADSAPPASPPRRRLTPVSPPAEGKVARDRRVIADLIEDIVADPATSLVGLSWLTGWYGFHSEDRWALRVSGAMGDVRVGQLIDRVTTRDESGTDLGVRASVICGLSSWQDGLAQTQRIADNAHRFRRWVDRMTVKDAAGMEALFNWLGNDRRDLTEELLRDVDVENLVARWVDGDLASAATFGKAVERICYAGGTALYAAVAAAIDGDAMLGLFRHVTGELWAPCQLTETVGWIDPSLSLRLVSAFLPQIAAAINDDPVESWPDIHDTLWFVLGFTPGFLRQERPSKQRRRIAARLAAMLDTAALADAIAHSRPRDWQALAELMVFVWEAAPQLFQDIAAAVDMDAFSETVAPHLDHPRWGSLQILGVMAEARPEATGRIVGPLIATAESLVALHAIVAPNETIEALHRGVPVDLGAREQEWEMADQAVTALACCDPDTAGLVLAANLDAIKHGLQLGIHGEDHAGLSEFLARCDQVSPGMLDAALAEIIEDATPHWQRELGRRDRARRPVLELVRRAARVCPDHAKVRHLLRRFPSLGRVD